MLTLWFTPGSSSLAPHIALLEIGVPFTPRPVSLHRGEQREPSFRALNPAGQVPVLVTADGTKITEVLAILFYLARRFPEAGLLPATDPLTEAAALSWMSFTASFLHPARTQPLERAIRAFEVAEARLGTADWALGERYSIADIHLFRLFWRFRTSREPPAGCLPRLEAHEARMMARPAVARAFAAEAAVGYHLPP